MTPLDEDEFRPEAQEIVTRIDEEHQRGGHVSGYVAGCSICARLRHQQEAQQAAAEVDVETLARLRLDEQTPAPAPVEPGDEPNPHITVEGGFARPDGVIPIAPRRAAAADGTLGDVALEDAQQALDDLEGLGKLGIVVPNAQQAIAHALVGVVRALAGIEAQMAELIRLLNDPDPEGTLPLPPNLRDPS